jgi:hypothetical protein
VEPLDDVRCGEAGNRDAVAPRLPLPSGERAGVMGVLAKWKAEVRFKSCALTPVSYY